MIHMPTHIMVESCGCTSFLPGPVYFMCLRFWCSNCGNGC